MCKGVNKKRCKIYKKIEIKILKQYGSKQYTKTFILKMFEYSTLELAHIMSSIITAIMALICYNKLFNKIEISLTKIKKEKELAEQKIKCLEIENEFLKDKFISLNR
jgi:hypothetical protein